MSTRALVPANRTGRVGVEHIFVALIETNPHNATETAGDTRRLYRMS